MVDEARLGPVTMTFSGTIKTSAWSDFETEWHHKERTTVEAGDEDHVGWVIGCNLGRLALALIDDNVCGPDEMRVAAAKGFASVIEDAEETRNGR